MRSLSIFIIALFIYSINLTSCKSSPNKTDQENNLEFDQAVQYFNDNKKDSAYKLFAKIAGVEKNDSLKIARSLIYMGIIQFQSGDYYGSQEVHLKALGYLNTENPQHRHSLFSVNHELGNTLVNLKFYDQAIEYYEKGLTMLSDDKYKNHILNNIAVAHFRAGNYKEAINIYKENISNTFESPLEYARNLSNYHRALWYIDTNYDPRPSYWEAMSIRRDNNDLWGLNASYAHLSEYYVSKRKLDSAKLYSTKRLELTEQLQNPEDRIEAIKMRLSIQNSSNENQLFQEYIHLNDSLHNARSLAKNQFTLIRYQVSKAKADNLLLEKENRIQNIALLIMVVILIGIMVLYYLYVKLIQKNNLNKMNELKLLTSQKVHDVVANGLYDLMSKVEHDVISDKEILLEHLEILYDQSRDISYDEKEDLYSGNIHMISNMIKNYSSADRKINIVGNVQDVIHKMDIHSQNQIMLVVKELLINMKKHSLAQNVSFKFEQDAESIIISYIDDGVGLMENHIQGNGLKNVENRINKLKGKVNFEKRLSGGLAIKINVPNNQ